MEKDQLICFETTLEAKNTIEKIASELKLSVPLVVESIVNDHLQEQNETKCQFFDRRHFERKQVDIAAFMGHTDQPRRDFKEGKIVDLSMAGVKFSIPKDTKIDIQENAKDDTLSIIFSLPQMPWPVHVKIQPKRLCEREERTEIGAIFVKPDQYSFNALSSYLM